MVTKPLVNENQYKLSQFTFELPPSLIAQRPVEVRDQSRLLVYYEQEDRVEHHQFKDLLELLQPPQKLVLNQSKVIPCRLQVNKPTGAKAEVFILSFDSKQGLYPCFIKANGKKKIGDQFLLKGASFTIKKREQEIFFLSFKHPDELNLIDFAQDMASIPIPPYIREGVADERDQSDYQTVYAQSAGSVAAPTAGLHFTQALLEQLGNRGIDQIGLTLHVGAGTFRPIQTENILEHQMHAEAVEIKKQSLAQLQVAQDHLIAVGTTALRSLEHLYQDGSGLGLNRPLKDLLYQTDLFLYPGKPVFSIAGLITNFHLPESSLFVLICSLVGTDKARQLYQLAIENHYRFYSYGDAMLILRNQEHLAQLREQYVNNRS
jgi:S-adenosylmethionine:tRNA ribosyltransferase-isomerase